MTSRWLRRLIVPVLAIVAVVFTAGTAEAHPLGNFTINHYDGLTVTPHAVRDHVVVDSAEIPTEQARRVVDRDGDGAVSADERASYAEMTCRAVAHDLRLTVAGRSAAFAVGAVSYHYRPGAAGLPTARLDCSLSAAVEIVGRSRVLFDDGYAANHIGWREVTATADGTHLVNSPVPAASVSDELRHYPNDLLSSPLDVHGATITVVPGAGTSTVAADIAKIPGAGPVARVVDRLNRLFSGLAGARHLGVGVALLAVLVSLLLGASHAALPGHGKTVMAAYLAGKHGTARDAFVVGATVTATHTMGVLALGLGLTLSTTLAGERVTNDLGVVSGALVALVGVGLLWQAVRGRRQTAHVHDHDHDHDHVHDHVHDHPHKHRRLGLVGMGVAGGLVPSPSAVVVLLGAIALGRTWFGVLLVVGYGLGMAATLTAAGLLLVRLSSGPAGRRLGRLARGRLRGATPAMTASLVLLVGVGLAVRSLAVV